MLTMYYNYYALATQLTQKLIKYIFQRVSSKLIFNWILEPLLYCMAIYAG